MEDKSVKLIAFHLPQFHSFPENDAWWGKGFTEWTNVKKSKPLYKNHYQPRIPEQENYYNLLNEDAIQHQMDLAKEYGIYGFCYYHYWFCGKLLMEKPLEKMLHMKDKLHYCFCWANEPWTRAWNGNAREVIMPQNYGEENEWEEHFRYLLPFFQDEFYIKRENKPIFVLYRTNNIPHCDEMIQYLNKSCKENGFAGIYVIEEKNSFQKNIESKEASAVLEFEPMYTLKYGRSILRRIADKCFGAFFNKATHNHMLIYNYDIVWKNIINRTHDSISGKEQFIGAFVDWDNSPRRGNKGTVIYGATPQKFRSYLSKQLQHARSEDSEYVFINAWNEWGEGTYLEPDMKYGKKYLEAVKTVVENQ